MSRMNPVKIGGPSVGTRVMLNSTGNSFPSARTAVISIGLHSRDGLLLADGSRQDDKRNIQALLLHNRQGVPASESRHGMVGECDVPSLVSECSAQTLDCLHPFPGKLKTALFKSSD